jgi:hypothetical protein
VAAAIAAGNDIASTPEKASTWRDSQQRQQARLQGVDQLRLGEHPAEAGERIQGLELRAERLRGPGPAAHRDARRDGDQHHRQAERHGRHRPGGRALGEAADHRAFDHRLAAIELQRRGEGVLQRDGGERRCGNQERTAGGDRREVAEVAGTRNLAFRPRLVELALRCGKVPVLSGGVGHGAVCCGRLFRGGRKT